MAKMDELFNEMYAYCEENNCWKTWMTASDWNKSLGTKYGPASFTALVNAGRLEKGKRNKATAYEYHIIPTGTIKEKMAQAQKECEREDAERVIKSYDENIARIKARYEEMIREAEERLKRDLEFEAEKLAKAEAILNGEC